MASFAEAAVYSRFNRAMKVGGNSGRANGFTRVVVRAIAEAFLVHRANHLEDTAVLFRLALRKQPEMTGFRADEEHGRTVRACGCACPAPDAGGSVHREIGNGFRNREGVRIGSGAAALGDKAARLNDPIESARSTVRSRMTGKGATRNGSTVMTSRS